MWKESSLKTFSGTREHRVKSDTVPQVMSPKCWLRLQTTSLKITEIWGCGVREK